MLYFPRSNKLACFVNNEDLFKINYTVHNFWKKSYKVHIFGEAPLHQKSWISNSFSPANDYLYRDHNLYKVVTLVYPS